jgi:4-alpha-methyl-delta7-sterol-4alpha-methyl oxidase
LSALPWLAPWWEAWASPVFQAVALGGTAVSLGAFLAAALPLTLLAWRTPAWAAAWRLHREPAEAWAQLGPGLRATVRNHLAVAVALALAWPAMAPWVTITLGPAPPWWVGVAQVVLFVYLDDALYWLMHRGMHSPWLFRRVHRVHHRIHRPTAISGHDMHVVEYAATAALMLVGPMLVGAHVTVLYAWIAVRQWEAAEGHSGLHLPFSPLSWLPGGRGADAHDLHHAKVHGNYAGILGWVDEAAGTALR